LAGTMASKSDWLCPMRASNEHNDDKPALACSASWSFTCCQHAHTQTLCT